MPAVAAGEPSRSASSIVADTARGYHILRIDGYSLTKATPTGEFLKSHPFTVGGHRWCIRYYPNGDSSNSADYVSFYVSRDGSAGEAVKLKAQYKICFADEVRETPSTMEGAVSFDAKNGWGYKEFIKKEDLEKSKHLKDDSFSVRCDIIIINKFRAEKEEVSEIDTPVFVSVPPSDLHQYYGDLLRTEKGADVVFEVGAETFAAHRCVLAIRSSVFSAELFGSMKEGDTTGVVRIDDMEIQVFKALLHFVYTDSLPEANKEDEEAEEDVMAQHLLVAADRYNLERLKLICEDKLCRYIDAGTVATVLTLAEQHHCNGLKKACFSFLSSWANLKAAMATDGFDHLTRSCPSVMKELLAVPRT